MDIVQLNLFDQEVWKPVVGYEGLYEVSSFGRVKSLGRIAWNGQANHQLKEKILKQSLGGTYLNVALSKNGKPKTKRIHQLVAETFLPQPLTPTGRSRGSSVVNHLDSNPLNNRADNLEWTTHAGNMNWSYKTNGQSPRRNVRFTDEQVLGMRQLRANGMSLGKIGKVYNCHSSTVSTIVQRKTFKHLP
ncbi:NUMOD4 domain-containing protein [Chroococcidiopsis sp.]|uniref:NUMOD4 domain-containing protein n=1 Tax=Chroococcidiopsis sp. TaxID=3088168 RepID=UPI003F39F8E3